MDDVEVLAVVPDGLVEAPNLTRGPVLRCVLKQKNELRKRFRRESRSFFDNDLEVS